MEFDLCLHMDRDDIADLRLVLSNCANYLKGLPGERFRLVVVINGPGVKLFAKAHAEGRDQAAALQQKGVRFLLCGNALNANGLSLEDMWPGCEAVPAGLVEIVRLQRAGFAYVKP